MDFVTSQERKPETRHGLCLSSETETMSCWHCKQFSRDEMGQVNFVFVSKGDFKQKD